MMGYAVTDIQRLEWQCLRLSLRKARIVGVTRTFRNYYRFYRQCGWSPLLACGMATIDSDL